LVSDAAWPALYPHLHYHRPAAAVEWLCRVFAFRETLRMDRDGDNIISRLEGPDGGLVMLSGLDDDFKQWMRQRAPQFREPSEAEWPHLCHAISVVVSDVDSHCERAKSQGAAILTGPRDQPWGLRSYSALDPEGHQWEFNTRLAPVEPEAWGARRIGGTSTLMARGSPVPPSAQRNDRRQTETT
jgi:uncharacterized glyoxalase superfamily protein PhnB